MKNKTITIKISESELKILENKAAKCSMNKSEFMRKAGIHSAVEINQIDKQFQKKLLFLLSNVTNNINQIAHHCNTKKEIDFKTLEELKKISETFKSVVSSQL